MDTEIIGNVLDRLNLLNLEEELLACQKIPPCVSYPDDFCGLLRTYPLWNQSGDPSDAYLYKYDGAAQITDIGIQLSHLSNLVKNTFNLEYLKLCRLHEYTSGTFFLPHRDYLDGSEEIGEIYTRMYIPVKIQEQCWNSYEQEVFDMELGDLVFHNGSLVHSVCNFSSESRFRLEFDFDPQIPVEDLFKDKSVLKLKELKSIPREPFSEQDLNKLLEFAGNIINCYNFKDIAVLFGKIHFQKNVNCALIYDWLEIVVEKTGNLDLLDLHKKTRWHLVDRKL
ncbi:MAG: hypothetical protein F6J93_12945 [Oscillatoria sp. SIO1A7]|nr:hypothetical protein [Oscillatoria sp. SIO1A7]